MSSSPTQDYAAEGYTSGFATADSSGYAADQTMLSNGSERDHQLIPLYFRLVPKDVWVRMHVDVRATIGSVKDAILERLRVPPYDPTLSPAFYEEAKAAMSRQSATYADARSLPKAFVARTPKRNVDEVLRAEQDIEASGSMLGSSSAVSFSSPRTPKPQHARRTPNFRSIPAAGQARAILGGDAGVGGRGEMGFVMVKGGVLNGGGGDNSSAWRSDNSYLGTPLKPQSAKPHSVTTPPASREAQARCSGEKRATSAATDTHHEPPLVDGDADSDAYMDYFGGALPGNEEAKRSEAAAMATIRALDVESVSPSASSNTNEIDALSSSPFLDRVSTFLSNLDASSSGDSPFRTGLLSRPGGDEDDLEDDADEGEMAYKELVARSRSISLHSTSSSSDSISSKEAAAIAARAAERDAEDGDDSAETSERRRSVTLQQSSSSVSSKGERARSGTIMPADVRRSTAAAVAALGFNSQAPSASSRASSASYDAPAPNGVHHQFQPTTPPAYVARTDSSAIAAKNGGDRRLAGIHRDEISSWKEAQHGQARHYAIHSFSNGHMLEDWRTVAAFRIRPYELLEVQFADPREKVHLPRIGEAMEQHIAQSRQAAAGGSYLRGKEEVGGLGVSSSGGAPSSMPSSGMQNPAFDPHYLDQFCEGWCYIFKRGGGTSKAQRAGLGLWKLRFVSVRGNRLSVFRRKQARAAVEQQTYNVWNLDAVDSVFSERADGATRPVLMPITGLCLDTLTLTFVGGGSGGGGIPAVPPQPTAAPPAQWDESSTSGIGLSAGASSGDGKQASLSMRFITQLDHCAFFKACARAHLRASLAVSDPQQAALTIEWRRKALARATIAGMGGTVLPGKAARRGGRNALARARLRPSGVSREFDDADRWSSASEAEDTVLVRPGAQNGSGGKRSSDAGTSDGTDVGSGSGAPFSYGEAALMAQPATPAEALPSVVMVTPTTGSMFFSDGSGGDMPRSTSITSTSSTATTHDGNNSPASMASRFGFHAQRALTSPTNGRRRGFTLGATPSPTSVMRGELSPSASSSSRFSTRLFTPPSSSSGPPQSQSNARTGLGVLTDNDDNADDGSSPIPSPSSNVRRSVSRPEYPSSPSRAL